MTLQVLHTVLSYGHRYAQSGSTQGFREANFGADQASFDMLVIILSLGGDVSIVYTPYNTILPYRTVHAPPPDGVPKSPPPPRSNDFDTHGLITCFFGVCHFCTEFGSTENGKFVQK